MAAANNNDNNKTVLGKRRSAPACAPASPAAKAAPDCAPPAPRKKARAGMSKGVYYIGDPGYLTSVEDEDSIEVDIVDHTGYGDGYKEYMRTPRPCAAPTGRRPGFGETQFSVDWLGAVPLADMTENMRKAAWATVKAGHAVIEPFDADFTCMAAMLDCGMISWMRIGPCFYDLEEEEEEEEECEDV